MHYSQRVPCVRNTLEEGADFALSCSYKPVNVKLAEGHRVRCQSKDVISSWLRDNSVFSVTALRAQEILLMHCNEFALFFHLFPIYPS